MNNLNRLLWNKLVPIVQQLHRLVRQPMPRTKKVFLLQTLVNEQEDELKYCTSEWLIDNVFINHFSSAKKPFVVIETSYIEPFKHCLN